MARYRHVRLIEAGWGHDSMLARESFFWRRSNVELCLVLMIPLLQRHYRILLRLAPFQKTRGCEALPIRVTHSGTVEGQARIL